MKNITEKSKTRKKEMLIQACVTEQVNIMGNWGLIQFSWGLSEETCSNSQLTGEKGDIYLQTLNPPSPTDEKLPYTLCQNE